MSRQPLPGVIEGQTLERDERFSADVCIIGSGAGGAVTAAVLQQAGFKVVVLEEGGYFTSSRFRMQEDDAFQLLYQDGGTRITKDGAVTVMQGKAVGGTTVVNWTTSYRTPENVLELWRNRHGVEGFSAQELAPHFDAVEERLNIAPWPLEKANRNNRLLYDGCKALGWEAHAISRNVMGCADTGYCGLGCPVDAKRSMLVSYLPDAMDAGATVVSRCRVDRLKTASGEVREAQCTLLDATGRKPTGVTLNVSAKYFVLAAGAIGTPGILLRSAIEDAGGMTGKRTFIHPVVATAARYVEPVNGSRGAPQSVASKHFFDSGEKASILLEAIPIYPGLVAGVMPGFGAEHRGYADQLDHIALHLALLGDGQHEESPGGEVSLRNGRPVLQYSLTPFLWDRLREGTEALAKLQFASGAETVTTFNDPPLVMRGPADIAEIRKLPFENGGVPVFSAHVMGGAGISGDARRGVVRGQDLRHHRVRNLHVVDGSVFPTSLGVNPQETIYGIARLAATRLAGAWKA